MTIDIYEAVYHFQPLLFSLHWYFLISSYYLTVSNGCSLTALKSVEVTQSSGSFKGGFICLWYLHVFSALVFPYIFLLFDCFKWALIDCIEKCRGHSELWQFQGGGFICLWYLHVFSAVVFPYIFLLFDCFEWVLIDCIEKHRGHSEL